MLTLTVEASLLLPLPKELSGMHEASMKTISGHMNHFPSTAAASTLIPKPRSGVFIRRQCYHYQNPVTFCGSSYKAVVAIYCYYAVFSGNLFENIPQRVLAVRNLKEHGNRMLLTIQPVDTNAFGYMSDDYMLTINALKG